MTPIDRTELHRLRELAAAATPGPWSTSGPDSVAEWMIHSEADGWLVADAAVIVNHPSEEGRWLPAFSQYTATEGAKRANDNAEFIAFANPERVTRLVGLVEELTAFVHDYMHEGGAVADGLGERARVLLDRLGAT